MVLVQVCVSLSYLPLSLSYKRVVLLVIWFSTEIKMFLVVLATLFLLFTPLCSCLRGMSANTTCSSTCLPPLGCASLSV